MARVENTGAVIRHSEIGSFQDAASIKETGISAFVHVFEPSPQKFASLMLINKYWWAFMMDVHFIGLALLMGVVAVLDLRILGFAKQVPARPLLRQHAPRESQFHRLHDRGGRDLLRFAD